MQTLAYRKKGKGFSMNVRLHDVLADLAHTLRRDGATSDYIDTTLRIVANLSLDRKEDEERISLARRQYVRRERMLEDIKNSPANVITLNHVS